MRSQGCHTFEEVLDAQASRKLHLKASDGLFGKPRIGVVHANGIVRLNSAS
jgi:hypothetical protein